MEKESRKKQKENSFESLNIHETKRYYEQAERLHSFGYKLELSMQQLAEEIYAAKWRK